MINQRAELLPGSYLIEYRSYCTETSTVVAMIHGLITVFSFVWIVTDWTCGSCADHLWCDARQAVTGPWRRPTGRHSRP